jgi:hypothetical protein
LPSVRSATRAASPGSVAGRDPYFRARHQRWEFEIANEQGELPTDVGDKNGLVRRGNGQV